jgi:HlyD family secretion protein
MVFRLPSGPLAMAFLKSQTKKILFSFVLLFMLSALLYRWYLGQAVSVFEVKVQNFTQSVVASGQVKNPHRTDVGVQITGTVFNIPVQEGQYVNKGDVLIELESTELRAALRQAQWGVDQARLKLLQIRQLLEPVARQTFNQAQANNDNALKTLKRNKELLEKNFIGQSALDESIRAQLITQAQWLTAQSQWQSLEPGGSDFLSAQSALSLAQSAEQGALSRLQYARVLAKDAGLLISRNAEPGDVVQPGKSLMRLSPNGQTQLVIQIDEKNLSQLKIGQTAWASADAYSKQKFEATLAYINTSIDPQRGSVEVKLLVPDAPTYLKQDMTVSVDIEVAKTLGAKPIPLLCIHDITSHQPWVYKVLGAKLVRKNVTLGVSSAGFVDVVEGLNEGDQVTLDALMPLKANERVQPLLQQSVP